MLSVIAAMLVRWVFTATPLRLARAGLDDILSEMVKEEPKKEALFRAMLISKSTESSMGEKDIQDLPELFLDKFGTIATAKARTDTKKDLRQLFEEASRSWMESRRSYQKVVATFDLKSFPNSWRSYPKPRYQRGQNAKHTQASEAEDEDGVAFFAFPAIVVRRDATEETVHRGVLIHYSHLHEAENEWQTEQKKRRFSRAGPSSALTNAPLL
jgi:hypothetical protein